MPIRPELRHFYRGPAWKATRARILERAGDRCEWCLVPNHLLIARIDRYRGWWFTIDGEAHDERGTLRFHFRGSEFDAPDRLIRVRLGVAHLNRTPGDDREENLRAFCQFCHLNYDRPINVRQAKETLITNRDARRPMIPLLFPPAKLQEAS